MKLAKKIIESKVVAEGSSPEQKERFQKELRKIYGIDVEVTDDKGATYITGSDELKMLRLAVGYLDHHVPVKYGKDGKKFYIRIGKK